MQNESNAIWDSPILYHFPFIIMDNICSHGYINMKKKKKKRTDYNEVKEIPIFVKYVKA